MKNQNNPLTKIYADLEGYSISGHTIPDNIYPTMLKPDLVFIDRPNKELHLLQLTVSYDAGNSIRNAHKFKLSKYFQLESDIDSHSKYKCELYVLR